MENSVLAEIVRLKTFPRAELEQKYAELFNGEKPATGNRIFLWRRIAYRLQELAYGGLSAPAQSRVNALIQEYDPVNNKALRPEKVPQEARKPGLRDRRLPIPGTVLIKEYKGTTIQVKALEKGFEYNGKVFPTLSAVANAVTGAHWNGYVFFRI
jgi:hypothetical protein